MIAQPYTFTSDLDRLQKNCRLTLQINGDKILLSFDDAIEFKLEIATLRQTGFPSGTGICGTIGQWETKFFPNKGGFSISVRHPLHLIATLALNKRQTVRFSEELQDFIDEAGQCSLGQQMRSVISRANGSIWNSLAHDRARSFSSAIRLEPNGRLHVPQQISEISTRYAA